MKLSRVISVAVLALASISQAHAQAYPNKPMLWVIPYAPGGGTDAISRPISIKLGQALGQTILYENRGGASGMVAAQAVAKAAPDGYTFLVAAGNTHTFSTLLFDNPGFDPVKDFSPITNFSIVPNSLVANPKFPASNLKELVAYGKANPGKINWASSGNGAGGHLGLVLFAKNAGIQVVHVPYKGSSGARTDVLGGQVQMMFDAVPTMVQNVRAGKVRAIATTGKKRSDVMPDVPTMNEAGVPGYDAPIWLGFMAPTGTPRPVVDKLNGDIARVVTRPDVKKAWFDQGADPMVMSPAEFDKFLHEDIAKWTRVVRASGAKVD